MPILTTNKGYKAYDRTSDADKLFIDFVDDQAGTGVESNISKIDSDMQANSDDIVDLGGVGRTTETVKSNYDLIVTNAGNIQTNTTDLSDLTTQLGSAFETVNTNIGTNTTNISSLTADVETNTTNIGTNTAHRTTVTGNPHEVKASEIDTNTTGFSGNLSAADANVQSALETLDAMDIGGSIAKFTVVIDTETGTIDIPIDIDDPTQLTVYQDGVLLTRNTHYTATTTVLTLIDYLAEVGDIFTFVGTSIAPIEVISPVESVNGNVGVVELDGTNLLIDASDPEMNVPIKDGMVGLQESLGSLATVMTDLTTQFGSAFETVNTNIETNTTNIGTNNKRSLDASTYSSVSVSNQEITLTTNSSDSARFLFKLTADVTGGAVTVVKDSESSKPLLNADGSAVKELLAGVHEVFEDSSNFIYASSSGGGLEIDKPLKQLTSASYIAAGDTVSITGSTATLVNRGVLAGNLKLLEDYDSGTFVANAFVNLSAGHVGHFYVKSTGAICARVLNPYDDFVSDEFSLEATGVSYNRFLRVRRIDSTRYIVAYKNGSDNNTYVMIVGYNEIEGLFISHSTPLLIAGTPSWISIAVTPNLNYAYCVISGSALYMVALTISGNTLTKGTAEVVRGAGYAYVYADTSVDVFCISNSSVTIIYKEKTTYDLYYCAITVSGATFTVSTSPVVLNSTTTNTQEPIFLCSLVISGANVLYSIYGSGNNIVLQRVGATGMSYFARTSSSTYLVDYNQTDSNSVKFITNDGQVRSLEVFAGTSLVSNNSYFSLSAAGTLSVYTAAFFKGSSTRCYLASSGLSSYYAQATINGIAKTSAEPSEIVEVYDFR